MNIRKITTAAALTLFVSTVPAAMAYNHSDGRGKAKGKAKHSRDQNNGQWSSADRQQFDQQFSRFDSNRDGLISRSEFPGDASLFNQLDLNRDGALTRGEVARALPDRASAERQIRSYDRNGDGIITRNEFPGDASAFDRLDRTRDGVLSEADRNDVRGDENENENDHDNDNNDNGRQMRFRGMDTNRDGVVTRAEWRGNDRSFRNHDRNSDGILSGDELRGRD